MAELADPRDKDDFVPAPGTYPTPPGKVQSSTCQYYRADKERLDLLRRVVRHRRGIEISRAAAERALVWAFDFENEGTVERYLDQAERFYWEDHRRTPGEDDGRRNTVKQAAAIKKATAGKKTAAGKKAVAGKPASRPKGRR